MRVGIMQPYFFPYIGYWQLMNSVDKFVVYDDVNYIKSGWINRNRILVNGTDKYINIGLKKASSNKLINDIELSDNKSSTEKVLKTINQSYKKAPYFSEVMPLIEDIMKQPEINLATYLEYSIRQISDYLGLSTEILVSSELDKQDHLRGQEKVIDICKTLSAGEYINTVGGQNLYNHKDFHSQGLTLKFLESKKVEYKQFNNHFLPNLSIIDIMMFNSKKMIKEMLNEYRLV